MSQTVDSRNEEKCESDILSLSPLLPPTPSRSLPRLSHTIVHTLFASSTYHIPTLLKSKYKEVWILGSVDEFGGVTTTSKDESTCTRERENERGRTHPKSYTYRGQHFGTTLCIPHGPMAGSSLMFQCPPYHLRKTKSNDTELFVTALSTTHTVKQASVHLPLNKLPANKKCLGCVDRHQADVHWQISYMERRRILIDIKE